MNDTKSIEMDGRKFEDSLEEVVERLFEMAVGIEFGLYDDPEKVMVTLSNQDKLVLQQSDELFRSFMEEWTKFRETHTRWRCQKCAEFVDVHMNDIDVFCHRCECCHRCVSFHCDNCADCGECCDCVENLTGLSLEAELSRMRYDAGRA